MIPSALLALQDLAEEAFEARSAGCLERVPAVILSIGTPSGGRFSLIHGGQTETVEPVGIAFATLKYVAHAPLGLFGVLFPGPLTVEKPLTKKLEALREMFEKTIDELDSLPVDPEARVACRKILRQSLDFASIKSPIDREGFKAYARRIELPVQQTMAISARAQLDGIGEQLARWRKRVGETDWNLLYAATASGWARVNNSPRQQALAQAMGPDGARNRLFCIQGVKTEEALLARLSKILNQHDLGELFFEDRERMDEDLMGRPAQKILAVGD